MERKEVDMAGSLIGGAATVGASAISSNGAKKAAKAQVKAAEIEAALQRDVYNDTTMSLAPQREAGYYALSDLSAIYGLPDPGPMPMFRGTMEDRLAAYKDGTYSANGYGRPPSLPDRGAYWHGGGDGGQRSTVFDQYGNMLSENAQIDAYNKWINGFGGGGGQPTFDQAGYDAAMARYEKEKAAYDEAVANQGNLGDLSSRRKRITDNFRTSPGYEFALNEGIKARDRSAARRGLLFSGAQNKAIERYAQGTADQEWNNYLAGLRNIAGYGNSATNTQIASGQNYANRAGSAYREAGKARATGYINSANAWSNAIGNLGQIGMYAAGRYGNGKGWF